MFIPVEMAGKYDVNLKSNLHLLCIGYLRKSTNPVYIYSRFALCGKIMVAFCKNLSKYVANLYVCVTVFQRLPKLHPKTFACVLLM